MPRVANDAARARAALGTFWAAVRGAAGELRDLRLVDWRIINLVVIILLVPGVLVYLFAPLVLITSEPAITTTFGVLPWLIILMLSYALFLVFIVFGFVGALFRNLRLFRSYLIMLVGQLLLTAAFFGEVLLLFQSAFEGGQYTIKGVDFTCGANETILILSVIDKTTGNPIPPGLWNGANSSLLGFDGEQISGEFCSQTRRVLVIVLIILGIIFPLLCCGPCIYAGVKYFKELSDAKREFEIDLVRNPYGGNDPSPYDMPGSGPPDGHPFAATPVKLARPSPHRYAPLAVIDPGRGAADRDTGDGGTSGSVASESSASSAAVPPAAFAV